MKLMAMASVVQVIQEMGASMLILQSISALRKQILQHCVPTLVNRGGALMLPACTEMTRIATGMEFQIHGVATACQKEL
jgi:hypothetical protein